MSLKINIDDRMQTKFESYPTHVQKSLQNLRRIIIETAEEIESISEIEETLKWGEPSYLAKKGSTIRINWLKKTPDQYAIYFKCTSLLVSTFKTVYGNLFKYENNRALLFEFGEKISEQELKKCIKAALTYHKVKKEVNLGIIV